MPPLPPRARRASSDTTRLAACASTSLMRREYSDGASLWRHMSSTHCGKALSLPGTELGQKSRPRARYSSSNDNSLRCLAKMARTPCCSFSHVAASKSGGSRGASLKDLMTSRRDVAGAPGPRPPLGVGLLDGPASSIATRLHKSLASAGIGSQDVKWRVLTS